MTNRGGQVIVGATSEIARALARELAMDGSRLVIAARDTEDLELLAADLRVRSAATVTPIALDVTAFETHDDFLERCITELGTVEGLILCQGFMADQRAATQDWSLTKQMIEVNYTSSVSLGNRFAAHMAKNGRGYICGVSSVAGDRGRQSNYLYGSTKAAFSTYLAGLRNLQCRNGVSIITIKPGLVDTAMTWGNSNAKSLITATPEQVARDISWAIGKQRSAIYTPWFWAPIMLAVRLIPESIFKRLSL